MRFFVSGVGGQLGYDVAKELLQRGHTVMGTGLELQSPISGISYLPLDIRESVALLEALRQYRPDAVIHCAAWTAVDLAEEPANLPQVRAVNVEATECIAAACKELGSKLTYLSTDYVFDGSGNAPWQEDSVDFAPCNVYGQSKLDGERVVRSTLERHFILRISWVFGSRGSNFVKTMLSLAQKYDALRVVNDQVGAPTYTVDLARFIVDLNESEAYGTYHASNEGGDISWYEFACEIFRQADVHVQVSPVSTAEYGLSKARRPYNSRLSKTKLRQNGFLPLPDWQDALERYLKEIRQKG